MLSCLFALMASLCAWLAPPQEPTHPIDARTRLESLSPIVAQSIDGADVWTLHANGSESLFGVADDGTLVCSFATTGGKDGPQGPIGSQPVPTLRSSWCDALGVTHEVTTPIDSSTAAGIDRATDLHEKLVARLQAKHPPRPCPPP